MGRCCENDNVGAQCLEGSGLWDNVNNKLIVAHSKSTDFENRMNAMAACPQRASTCG